MRIDRMEVYYVVFPLVYPWVTAYGADPDAHCILVKLVSGDGWVGVTARDNRLFRRGSALSLPRWYPMA